jgi:TonB dependent receptor/TonB-dependent Receptor Plug Domain
VSQLSLIAIVLLGATAAAADPAPDEPLASAASSQLSRAELDERAQGRTVDLLRHLPGLYAIEVDGGGQAEAYLTRGFDAHSGLDLEVLVDDVPVNIAGPGADHGYADTQFVIPEAVDTVALHLGPYAARSGNFASAGTLELHTLDEVPGGGAIVQLSSGAALTQPLASRLRHLLYRVTAMASPALSTSHALLAVELGIGGGPFVHPLDMHRGSLLGKWSYPFAGGVFQVAATMFSGRADAAGVVPQAEVEAGRVDRFGALDATLGDTATRASVSAGVTAHDAAGGSWHLGGYAVAASHRIYTNPTAFLLDADRGDQREQVDDGTLVGLDGWYLRAHRLWGMPGQLRLGVQARADDGTAELWHDAERVRLDTCVAAPNPCLQATSKVRDLAVYAEDALHLGRVTLSTGLRLDQVTWDSADTAPATPAPASGNAARARLNPKLGVTAAVAPGVELSALAGGGFRTSDTRAVIATDALRGMPQIWSAELGARLRLAEQLSAGLAAYAAWQDAEVRWIADLRAAEPVPRSRRTGLDGHVAYTPVPWLTVDANLSVAHAVANPGASEAPVLLAPRIFGGAGVTLRRAASFVSLRGLGLGARRAADQLATPAQAVLSFAAGTRWRGFTLGVSVENLLDAAWREQQSALTVRASRTADPITGLVYTPGAPLTAVITVGYGV